MGTRVDHAALGSMLGSPVLAAGSAGLPDALRQAEGPVPPLGKLFGLPLVVDARVTSASVLVFHAFSENDFIEISYEDFARLEQPRIGSFALAGELGRGGSAAHPR
jgi:Ala-tRNA(Pro) deacylase